MYNKEISFCTCVKCGNTMFEKNSFKDVISHIFEWLTFLRFPVSNYIKTSAK